MVRLDCTFCFIDRNRHRIVPLTSVVWTSRHCSTGASQITLDTLSSLFLYVADFCLLSSSVCPLPSILCLLSYCSFNACFRLRSTTAFYSYPRLPLFFLLFEAFFSAFVASWYGFLFPLLSAFFLLIYAIYLS